MRCVDLDTTMQSEPAHQNDLIDLVLAHLGVMKDTLDRVHDEIEDVGAELFELGARKGRLIVDAIDEGVDFDRGARGG